MRNLYINPITWKDNILQRSDRADGGTSVDIRAMRILSSQFGTFQSFYEHNGNIQLRLLHDIPYLPFVPKPNVLTYWRRNYFFNFSTPCI